MREQNHVNRRSHGQKKDGQKDGQAHERNNPCLLDFLKKELRLIQSDDNIIMK